MIKLKQAQLYKAFHAPGVGQLHRTLNTTNNPGIEMTLVDSNTVKIVYKGFTYLIPFSGFECVVPEDKE